VKYVTVEAALVNCIVPEPLQPTMHPHETAFMWFRALRWCFSSTMVTGELSWALLDFLGGVACDVCSCASQLYCAGSIAANHACTGPHIHSISCFKVTFSCALLIIQLLRWPFHTDSFLDPRSLLYPMTPLHFWYSHVFMLFKFSCMKNTLIVDKLMQRSRLKSV